MLNFQYLSGFIFNLPRRSLCLFSVPKRLKRNRLPPWGGFCCLRHGLLFFWWRWRRIEARLGVVGAGCVFAGVYDFNIGGSFVGGRSGRVFCTAYRINYGAIVLRTGETISLQRESHVSVCTALFCEFTVINSSLTGGMGGGVISPTQGKPCILFN